MGGVQFSGNGFKQGNASKSIRLACNHMDRVDDMNKRYN